MLRFCGDSRPSHITVLRNRRFVAGSGRRYIDAERRLIPHEYGSSTESIANSAFAGTFNSTRMVARLSSRLNARCRADTVETSASGQFEPSFVRKTGSSPSDAPKRFWTVAGGIVQ